jgi:hypothetical protein
MLTEFTITPVFPASIIPGQPFEARWAVAHHGNVDARGATFAVRTQGLRVISLAMDGAPLDASSVSQRDDRTIVALPTLRPAHTIDVSAWVLADVPVVGDVALGYEYLHSGTRAADMNALTIQANDLALDGELVLEDASPVCRGEVRTGFIRLRNRSAAVLEPVSLVCVTDQNNDVELSPMPERLKPGAVCDIPFRVTFAELELKDEVSLSVIVEAGSYTWESADTLSVVAPPALGQSVIELLNDAPLSPAGGMLRVQLTALNTGSRPAVRPSVRFTMPSGVELVDGDIVLPVINPGEPLTRTFSFRVGPTASFELGAALNTEALPSLEIPVQEITSLQITQVECVETIAAGEAFTVKTSVFANGNAAISRASISLTEATHFSYVDGSFRINGLTYPDDLFARDHRVALKNVQAGALVELEFGLKALTPTTSAPGVISISARWGDGNERVASTRSISVRPSLLAGPLFEIDEDTTFHAVSPTPIVDAAAISNVKIVTPSVQAEPVPVVAHESTLHAPPVLRAVVPDLANASNQGYTLEDPPAPVVIDVGNITSLSTDHAADYMQELDSLLHSSAPNEQLMAALYLLPPPGRDASVRYHTWYEGLAAIVQESMKLDAEMRGLTDEEVQAACDIVGAGSATELLDMLRPAIAQHFPEDMRDRVLSELTIAA